MVKGLRNENISIALKMAVPAMIESFFGAFAGLVDSYMVSGISSEAVAAVGLTTQPKFLGLSAFIAINVSLSALVARRFGENKKEDANGVLYTGIIFISLLCLVISTVMVFFASPIIKFCGSTPETHDMAVTYFRIIMSGMFFMCVQMGINSAQRGAGNTRITMVTNLTSNTVNILFNYLLINGYLGFPKMGVAGAALATVLGTVVGAIMSIKSICSSDCFVSIPFIIHSKVKPTIDYLKNIISVSYSVFFEQMLTRVGLMATAIMAAKQGNYAMAAHQVGMNIMGLTFSFGDGLQSAAVALIGKSLGENKAQKARDYGSACQKIGTITSFVLAIIYFFGAQSLMELFFREREIVLFGVSIMYVIVIAVLFQIRAVIYTGCLRGAGDTKYTAVSAAISTTVIRTAISYLCANIFNLGIVGVWLGVMSDQFFRLVFSAIRFKQGKWVNIKI